MWAREWRPGGSLNQTQRSRSTPGDNIHVCEDGRECRGVGRIFGGGGGGGGCRDLPKKLTIQTSARLS